jgi:hypothetical protein
VPTAKPAGTEWEGSSQSVTVLAMCCENWSISKHYWISVVLKLISERLIWEGAKLGTTSNWNIACMFL